VLLRNICKNYNWVISPNFRELEKKCLANFFTRLKPKNQRKNLAGFSTADFYITA
jgi:hypothetical protein